MRRKTLTADELAAVERSVDIPPLGEHHTVTIRHERSRFADAIRQLPTGGQIVLAGVAIGLTVLIFVSTIMVLSALLPGGPPQSCAAHGGVFKVEQGTGDTSWSGMIVCRDGTSYTN